jgi:RhoGEF domain
MSLNHSTSSIHDGQHENDDRECQITQLVQEQNDQDRDESRPARRSAEAALVECEDLETKRQELIREICQTEESFVKRLQVFVQFFVLPLRVHNSKTWISGVPSEVARLFDWVEDIMNLHNQMLSALQATRTAQYPVVERVAECIRAFIPRFEVYQPYLVRLADVVALMERLVQDETSDFGEFLDIQQGAPQCDDWSFQMFLNEPVGRLAKYPDFFSVSVSIRVGHCSHYHFFVIQRLLRLTPKTHQDYLSTFSLVHSTDMVIHVLNEVKVREDEYDLIKSISLRIQGLPPSVQLATRERRLLFRGLLHLVNTEEVAHNSKTPPTTSMVSSDGSKGRGPNMFNRSSKLAVAIDEWDARRARSESTSSSSTGTSFKSLGTSSAASSDIPATLCSTFFSSYRISIPGGRLNNTTSRMPASPSPSPRRNSTFSGTLVQVFIFTDLVVLTAPTSNLAPAMTGDWTLLKDIGITRILGVTERLEEPYGL